MSRCKKTQKILTSLVKAVSIPVTIKIRLGLEASKYNAKDIVKVATDAGITWVSVHGRTADQAYRGKANWDYIAEIKEESTIPIIGNGDIISAQMAMEYLKKYNVDAIMIGRGSLKNPYIFEEANALWNNKNFSKATNDDYVELVKEHTNLLIQRYAPVRALMHTRKFMAWYSTGFVDSHKFRNNVFHIDDFEELQKRSLEFFSNKEKEK